MACGLHAGVRPFHPAYTFRQPIDGGFLNFLLASNRMDCPQLKTTCRYSTYNVTQADTGKQCSRSLHCKVNLAVLQLHSDIVRRPIDPCLQTAWGVLCTRLFVVEVYIYTQCEDKTIMKMVDITRSMTIMHIWSHQYFQCFVTMMRTFKY